MAVVQVILQGARIETHDVFDYPLILQFGEQKTYDAAIWFLPSFERRIPAWRLSEIRVRQGPLTVLVDGPEGFRFGPYEADYIRNYYPRGKSCSFIKTDPDSKTLVGVSLSIVEGSLIVEPLGGPTPTPAGA
jgi:hypothetical protein